ncbi:hypothetical protein Salat_2761300 [Sesamum alatum]|uniref:Uncharacterized protein n=1 Tax=Sesamum alatum TaxID=300844 RepID=A0AAE1XL77_9LAMI|nr:hypothetical protein Salat_2761300 [Sesamum alatum]
MQYPPRGLALTWLRDLGSGRPTLARVAHLCLELGRTTVDLELGCAHSHGAPSSRCLELSYACGPPSSTQLKALPRAGQLTNSKCLELGFARPSQAPGLSTWVVFCLGALTTLS